MLQQHLKQTYQDTEEADRRTGLKDNSYIFALH